MCLYLVSIDRVTLDSLSVTQDSVECRVDRALVQVEVMRPVRRAEVGGRDRVDGTLVVIMKVTQGRRVERLLDDGCPEGSVSLPGGGREGRRRGRSGLDNVGPGWRADRVPGRSVDRDRSAEVWRGWFVEVG